jgi:rubrerythrin
MNFNLLDSHFKMASPRTPSNVLGRRPRASSPHPNPLPPSVRRRLWPRPEVGGLRPRAPAPAPDVPEEKEEAKVPQPMPVPDEDLLFSMPMPDMVAADNFLDADSEGEEGNAALDASLNELLQQQIDEDEADRVHLERYNEYKARRNEELEEKKQQQPAQVPEEKKQFVPLPQTPLMQELKCSICRELLVRTQSCVDGHNVCGNCFGRLSTPRKCPICRRACAFHPNAFVDRLVRSHFGSQLLETQQQHLETITTLPDMMTFFNESFEPITELGVLPLPVLRAMAKIRVRGQVINTANMRQAMGNPSVVVTITNAERRNKWWLHVAKAAALYSDRNVFSVFEMNRSLYTVGSNP